jgi:hypothetical protein
MNWKDFEDYFPYPLQDEDWKELAKNVTYKHFEKGEKLPGNFYDDDEKLQEIYIVLKGKVKLAFPIQASDNPHFQKMQVVTNVAINKARETEEFKEAIIK